MTPDELVAAGGAALRDGRWAEARDAFEAVLRERPDRPDAVALDGLGAALWWLGEPRRSVECREQAYARFRRGDDRAGAIRAALGVAVSRYSNFGSPAVAGGWVARAERLLEGPEDPYAGWVQVMRAYVTTDPARSVASYRRCLEQARRDGDPDLELCSLSGLGERLVLLGEVDEGMALLDEAMAAALAGEPRSLDTVVYTSCDLLVACDLVADLDRARQWCRAADRFIARYGCPFLSARCRMVYGSVLVASGDWAGADTELRQAIALGTAAGPAMAAEAAGRLADLRLRQGRIEDAAALLDQAGRDARTVLAAAALRLSRGDAGGAVALLRDTPGDRLPEVLALLVRAHLAGGDVGTAATTAARLDRIAATGPPYAEALAAVAAAGVATATGAPDAAERWQRAAASFSALGMPYDAARCRLELARALAASRPADATAEAEAALSVFGELGAAADGDAAAGLLRSLGRAPARGPRGTGVLTDRERQVLRLIGVGLSNPEIGARLHISRKTAEHHVSNVLGKLGARNRAEAVARAGQVVDP